MMINVQKTTSAKRDVNKSFHESFVTVKSKQKKRKPSQKGSRFFVQPSGFSNRQVLIFMFTNQGSG